jgi:hypothetical protein
MRMLLRLRSDTRHAPHALCPSLAGLAVIGCRRLFPCAEAAADFNLLCPNTLSRAILECRDLGTFADFIDLHCIRKQVARAGELREKNSACKCLRHQPQHPGSCCSHSVNSTDSFLPLFFERRRRAAMKAAPGTSINLRHPLLHVVERL